MDNQDHRVHKDREVFQDLRDPLEIEGTADHLVLKVQLEIAVSQDQLDSQDPLVSPEKQDHKETEELQDHQDQPDSEEMQDHPENPVLVGVMDSLEAADCLVCLVLRANLERLESRVHLEARDPEESEENLDRQERPDALGRLVAREDPDHQDSQDHQDLREAEDSVENQELQVPRELQERQEPKVNEACQAQ